MTDLSISDERLECRAMNGIQLQEDCLLFLEWTPTLTVYSTVPFAAGMKFAVTYHYYPLGRFQHEQPGKACCGALNTIKLQAEAEKNDVLEQLQAALAENTRLNNQLTELQSSLRLKIRWKTCTRAAAGGLPHRCLRCPAARLNWIAKGVVNMYSSYSTLQRKQLTKQVYTDTQSTYLLVYAPGPSSGAGHALENQLHRKFRLVTGWPRLTDSVEGVLLVSEDLECTSTALTYFAAALRTGADFGGVMPPLASMAPPPFT